MSVGAVKRQCLYLVCIGALALTACGSPDANRATDTGETASIWANSGVLLPAGQRTAIAADGSGWVLSQPFADDTLQLVRFSLATGSAASATTIDATVHAYSGAGLASDGAGHLWITYGNQIVRFDEQSQAVKSWTIPSAIPRLPTNNPSAGNAQADLWDVATTSLLFVRNDDQRLYGFTPSTSSFAMVAELPITTSYISDIAVGPNGEIAVTGSVAGASAFSPAAARLGSLGAAPLLLDDVAATCGRSSGLAYMHPNGAVTLDNNALAATVRAPQDTHAPFACDSADNIFGVAGEPGSVLITRVSGSGAMSTATGALTPIVVHGLQGPVSTYASATISALVPDLQGGVWLISEGGTNSSTNEGSAYPSLTHVTFA